MLLAAGVWVAGYSSLIPDARSQAVNAKDIARCATIMADAERLACYDRLARSGPAEVHEPTATAAQPLDQSFGIIKPPATNTPKPSRLEAKVIKVTADARGGAIVQLDNDQTWALDDGPAFLGTGDAIIIKHAALGSFVMSTPTGRVYRVRRLK